MRRMTFGWLVVLALVSGCATRLVDLVPEEDAVYDQPIDEVWPQVVSYFRENGFAFRETPGRASLETEWREEFAGSRVAAYWHHYLVTAEPQGPHRCKVLVTRATRSVNRALQTAGSDLLWGTDERNARTQDVVSAGPEVSAFLASQQADENAVILGYSAQTARDRALEWKMFRKISPVLAASAQKSESKPDVALLKDSNIECGVPILGLGKLARLGNVVLLGELHGTQQVPHFVAQSACQLSTQGIPVTVGLEVPDVNQAKLETFLSSAGKEEDWARLMESPFWRSPYPDGRNSEGIAYLIEDLRKLRAQGVDVKLFAYDHPPLEGNAREEAMARTVREVAQRSSKRVMLVLSGNLHPRQLQGLPWDSGYRPMGERLAEQLPQVVSLDIAYKDGSAWICALGAEQKLDCGVKPARGKDNGDRFFVQLFGERNAQGYNGVYYVGQVSASLPAVYHGAEPAGDTREPVSGR